MSATAIAAGGPRRPVSRAALTVPLVAAPALGLLAVSRPLLALGVGLGVALGLVATARVEVGILLLVASGPVENAFNLGSSSLTVTKLAGALCFLTFFVNAFLTGRRFRVDKLHALTLVILSFALVSTLQAQDRGAAMTTTTRYASFVLLFFVVSQAVRSERERIALAWVLTLSSTTAAGIGAWSFLSGKTSIAVIGDANSNDLGFALAAALPLALWLLREPGWRRALAGLCAATMLAGVALSFSRGAALGLAVALVWQLFVERRHLGVIFLGVLLGVLALVLLAHFEPAHVKVGLAEKRHIAAENVSSRLEAWGAAARLTEDHPLLGVGPGNFQAHYLEATGRPFGTPKLAVVHDAYLDIAAELGIVAGLAFLAYVALAFGRLGVARSRAVGPHGFAAALRVSLLVSAVAALTLSEQYFAPFWLLGGLASGLYLEERESAAG